MVKNQMKILSKEIKSIIELFAAVLLGVIVIPLGLLHNIVKPFVDAFKFKRLKPLNALLYILVYYLDFIYQIWNVIKRLLHDIAVSIDIFGNATSGEMLEDLISPEHENTYFGDGRYTISAAIGEAEANKKLNKLGLLLSKALNWAFKERLHSIWSYEREILHKLTKENKGLK